MVMRSLPLLLALFLFSGCDEEFKPASYVNKLRVLAARAEPAEVQPGKVTQLTGLVVDPSRTAKPTVFWIACDPDPFNQGRTACATTDTFSDPSTIDLSTGELPAGMHFIGLGDRAAYFAPPRLFDVLEADDPIRQTGTPALVLMLAIGEEVSPLAKQEELAAVFERVRNKETDAVIALFRVMVTEKAVPNQNPEFSFVRYGDDEPPPNAHVLFAPDELRIFTAGMTDASYETYRQSSPTETDVEKVERGQVAWFSTHGRLSEEAVALDSEVPEEFTAPGYDPMDLVPPDRGGMLWAVLRDSRGGITWREQPFFSCNLQFPHPAIRSVTSPATAGADLVLEGENLDRIVDVLLNGTVVKGAYIASTGRWEGTPRNIPAGTYPLELRSADCAIGAESATVTIP
jgi:hypothetical protein